MPKIIVDVYPGGEIVVETKGFKGTSCQEATKSLEESLGKILITALTSEYYLESEVGNNVELNQNGS